MRPSVLAVNNYATLRGGSDRCFLEHVRLLSERGHRVVPLATKSARSAHDTNGRLAELDERLFLEPIDLVRPRVADVARFHYSRRARGAVEELVRSSARPDLAHLHIYYGQITASILAPLRRAGIPIVQTLHEYRLACPVSTFVSRGRICEACRGGRFWHALTRRCNRGSFARTLASTSESYVARFLGARRAIDLFLAPSEFLRRKMIEHGLPEERLATLPNFIDAARFQPGTRGRHFLYFGRLERLKGVLTLLRAAETVPEVPLLVVGEGEARDEIAARLQDPRLGHVQLLGAQPDARLFELVRESLCVVVPSEWYENLPLAVLEAMALGRAVVGSRIGGIPELVADGVTGWLFEPGDAGMLAERLRHAAEHPDEAEALGRAGRARVLAEFSPDAHYQRLLALYGRVL